MTAPQLVVLQAIANAQKPTAGELAQSALLSQATITSVLDRLQSAGLVTRQRDLEDGRVVRLDLTAAGRQRMQQPPGLLQDEFLQRFAH